MIDETRAAQIISRIQIIRTWAATPTAREDIPRISNDDCEKVVAWLDDAIKLLKEDQAKSTLGIVQTANALHFTATGDAKKGEERGIALGKLQMRDAFFHELNARGLMTQEIQKVLFDTGNY